MLRGICCQVVRLVVLILTLIICQVTFSFDRALAQEGQPSPTLRPEATERVSSPPRGETTAAEPVRPVASPESERKPAISESQVTYPQPPQAYNRQAIEEFNEELYGE